MNLALAMGLLTIAAQAIDLPSTQPIDEYVQDLRARGEPTTWSEFLAPAAADRGDLVAALSEVHADLVAARGPIPTWDPPAFWRGKAADDDRGESPGPPSDEERDALTQTVRELRPVLDRVAEASNRSRLGTREDLDLTLVLIADPKAPHFAMLELLTVIASLSDEPAARVIATDTLFRLARADRRASFPELLFCHVAAQRALRALSQNVAWGEFPSAVGARALRFPVARRGRSLDGGPGALAPDARPGAVRQRPERA